MITIVLAILIVVFSIRYYTSRYFGANRRFYDPYATFPCLGLLTENFESIRKEYNDCSHEMYDWPEKKLYASPGGRLGWKVLPLYGFGVWNRRANDLFPETLKVLYRIPGLRTAIFSKLEPNTTMEPHQGWADLANGALRCHLGITIPSTGRSGVMVENEFRQATTGGWIVFDDAKLHNGVNESDEERVVFIIDIDRPWWVRRGCSTVRHSNELDNFISTINSL